MKNDFAGNITSTGIKNPSADSIVFGKANQCYKHKLKGHYY